jgi:hypothetical protein
MFKDFSWGIVAAVAVGVVLVAFVMKLVFPSLPAKVQTYVPNQFRG